MAGVVFFFLTRKQVISEIFEGQIRLKKQKKNISKTIFASKRRLVQNNGRNYCISHAIFNVIADVRFFKTIRGI